MIRRRFVPSVDGLEPRIVLDTTMGSVTPQSADWAGTGEGSTWPVQPPATNPDTGDPDDPNYPYELPPANVYVPPVIPPLDPEDSTPTPTTPPTTNPDTGDPDDFGPGDPMKPQVSDDTEYTVTKPVPPVDPFDDNGQPAPPVPPTDPPSVTTILYDAAGNIIGSVTDWFSLTAEGVLIQINEVITMNPVTAPDPDAVNPYYGPSGP